MYEWSEPQRLVQARESARQAAERHPLGEKMASAVAVLEELTVRR